MGYWMDCGEIESRGYSVSNNISTFVELSNELSWNVLWLSVWEISRRFCW